MTLQLPEALGQHGCPHPRQPRGKIGESLRSGEQLAKQEQGPPVTDHPSWGPTAYSSPGVHAPRC